MAIIESAQNNVVKRIFVTSTEGDAAIPVFAIGDGQTGLPLTSSSSSVVEFKQDEIVNGSIAAAGTIVKQYIGDYQSFVAEFSATAGSHTVKIQGNATGLDVDQWYDISGYPVDIASTGVVSARPVTTGYTAFVYPKRFPWIRVQVITYGGSGTVMARLSLSQNNVNSTAYQLNLASNVNNNSATQPNPYGVLSAGVSRLSNVISDTTGSVYVCPTFATGAQALVLPYSVPEQTFQYSPPAGGITNSATAVAAKAAAGAGLRNYVTGLTLSTDTLGAATDFVVLDNTTPLYRIRLTAAALQAVNINFPTPLRPTANTAINIQTVTAVTGGVYCSLTGYVAP